MILLEVCIKGIKGLLVCQFTERERGNSVNEWENKTDGRGGERDLRVLSIMSAYILGMRVCLL